MNASDLNALVKGMAPAVRDAISTAVGDLEARVSLIEKASPLVVEWPAGPAGKDAEPVSIERLMSALAKDEQGLRTAFELMVHDAVEERLKALPTPEIVAGPPGETGRDGLNGKDGTSVTVEMLAKSIAADEHGMRSAIELMLHEATAEHLKAHPPAAGAAGEPGPAGERGAEGAVGPVGPQGAPGTDGAPGASGERGDPGMAGDVGQKGEQGIPGRDGLPGVSGPAGLAGKDGVNGMHGKDGADGLGFDDLHAEYDGERTFSLVFARGEQVKRYPFVVPFVLDRGVFSQGKAYEQGDGVSWGGSFFIAQKATTATPGQASDASRAWRLTVKRGGDGKEGPPGKEGKPGPRGDQGPQGKAGY